MMSRWRNEMVFCTGQAHVEVRRARSFEIVLLGLFLAAVVSCSRPSLVVSIAADGKSFYWEEHGRRLDPQAAGVVWEMQTDRWARDARPLHGQGRASINQAGHKYDAVALFTLDEIGYKHIRLTLSGGSLPAPLTAESARPGVPLDTQAETSRSSPPPASQTVPKLPLASASSDAEHWEAFDPQLSVLATVAKGVDFSNAPAHQYNVEVRVRNDGPQPVVFDSTVLGFIPAMGQPLAVVQTSRDLVNQEKIILQRLRPREEKTFAFDSDGYTSDLVQRSDPNPLLIEVILRLGSKRVAGPFLAELPPLGSLPEVTQVGTLPEVTQARGFKLKGAAVYLTLKKAASVSGR